MEWLIENTHELKGKMKEKVEANAELGLLSKKLATILLDVPVEFNAKNFELDEPDHEKVNEIFQELEFRRLIENFKKTFAVNKTNTAEADSNTTEKVIPKNTTAGTGQFSLFDAPA